MSSMAHRSQGCTATVPYFGSWRSEVTQFFPSPAACCWVRLQQLVSVHYGLFSFSWGRTFPSLGRRLRGGAWGLAQSPAQKPFHRESSLGILSLGTAISGPSVWPSCHCLFLQFDITHRNRPDNHMNQVLSLWVWSKFPVDLLKSWFGVWCN